MSEDTRETGRVVVTNISAHLLVLPGEFTMNRALTLAVLEVGMTEMEG